MEETEGKEKNQIVEKGKEVKWRVCHFKGKFHKTILIMK